MAKARANLARLAAQVAAGTFTAVEVIRRKAAQAAGRTHDLRGIFSWEMHDTKTGRELHVNKNQEAIKDIRDRQWVYSLRTTEGDLSDAGLWHT